MQYTRKQKNSKLEEITNDTQKNIKISTFITEKGTTVTQDIRK
jgi:hypothetical protein